MQNSDLDLTFCTIHGLVLISLDSVTCPMDSEGHGQSVRALPAQTGHGIRCRTIFSYDTATQSRRLKQSINYVLISFISRLGCKLVVTLDLFSTFRMFARTIYGYDEFYVSFLYSKFHNNIV